MVHTFHTFYSSSVNYTDCVREHSYNNTHDTGFLLVTHTLFQSHNIHQLFQCDVYFSFKRSILLFSNKLIVITQNTTKQTDSLSIEYSTKYQKRSEDFMNFRLLLTNIIKILKIFIRQCSLVILTLFYVVVTYIPILNIQICILYVNQPARLILYENKDKHISVFLFSSMLLSIPR